MRYFALDVETTSLVRSPDNLLSIAIIAEDTTWDRAIEALPTFAAVVKLDPDVHIHGQPIALAMNADLLRICVGKQLPPEPYVLLSREDLALELRDFIQEHSTGSRPVLAGANVGSFDRLFLPSIVQNLFHHRSIELGSVFIDWQQEGPPGTMELSKRFALGHQPAHDALEDARDVIRCLRKAYVHGTAKSYVA